MSVAWILIGLVVYGLLSSSIGTTLTVVTLVGGQTYKLFGAEVRRDFQREQALFATVHISF